MNLYRLSELQKLLKSRGLSLSKERGQNFLYNESILKQMADFVPNKRPILEIGPGFGHMTKLLAQKTNPYFAVELDQGFYLFLKEQFEDRIQLFHENFLKFDFLKLNLSRITVAGNIPYSISLEILLKLLRNLDFIEEFYLLVQLEFGEKLMAQPKNEKYGRITVLTQAYTKPEMLLKVESRNFFPAPNVDSVFMKFTPYGKTYDRDFEVFVTQIFSARRKTFLNLLKNKASSEILENLWHKMNYSKTLRAEELSPQKIFEVYQDLFSSH